MLITDAIDEYLQTKQNSITSDTYKWYTRFLTLFGEWATENRLMELERVTAAHVQQFVSASPTQNSHTLHARAQIVKGFLSWCAQDDEMGVKRRVVERIEMPKIVQSEVELLTDVDIKRLLAACDRTNHPYRNRALISTLLDTGIRVGECCYDSDRPGDETGLRMSGLILGRGQDSYIVVMGKGRKGRTLSLGNECALAMRRYITRERRIDRGTHTSEFVFLSRDGEPLSVRMLQQLVDEIGQLAGVKDVHPHRFRHTFAVNQLLSGTSDLILMRLMGHTTLDATKIYVRAMNQQQARRAAISVLDQMKGVRK